MSECERCIKCVGTKNKSTQAYPYRQDIILYFITNYQLVPQVPTRLIVSGIQNDLKILNCNVKEIIVSGSGNTITYPANCNPKVTNSGLNNSIVTG